MSGKPFQNFLPFCQTRLSIRLAGGDLFCDFCTRDFLLGQHLHATIHLYIRCEEKRILDRVWIHPIQQPIQHRHLFFCILNDISPLLVQVIQCLFLFLVRLMLFFQFLDRKNKRPDFSLQLFPLLLFFLGQMDKERVVDVRIQEWLLGDFIFRMQGIPKTEFE